MGSFEVASIRALLPCGGRVVFPSSRKVAQAPTLERFGGESDLRHPPKTLLKVLVDQRKWRYTDFERTFNATAAKLFGKGTQNPTVGETQFRRWTGGKLKGYPGPDTCRALEAMFDVPVADLFAPPPVAADPDIHTFTMEDEIAMTAREAQDDAGAIASVSISDTIIDQLRDDAVSLAREYHERPVFEMWRRAQRLRREMEEQRDLTRVPAQEQELLVLSGQSVALLAVAAFDLGSLAGARRLARTAALYGESARFEPLIAYAEGCLAYIAYFSAEPSRALSLAHRALTRGGLGDVATRRLRAIEGRAHAHLGDTVSARRAIRLSQEDGYGHRDDLHDGVGGEFGFTAERLAMSNSSTALLIGDGVQAEAAARQALTLIQTRPSGSRSAAVLGSAAADLALARLMSDDVDGAAVALEPLWTVPGEQRATGLLTRAARLRRLLSQPRFHGSPLPAELSERIETFIQSSAARQIGGGLPEVLALEA
ncbi:DNA-binding protein [Streptomyces jumonjinensis]|uniref:DNA-binding protein n=1 Tax=Streptomyces jumonjinensis TaxID=1945 RepID=UPI00379DBC2E